MMNPMNPRHLKSSYGDPERFENEKPEYQPDSTVAGQSQVEEQANTGSKVGAELHEAISMLVDRLQSVLMPDNSGKGEQAVPEEVMVSLAYTLKCNNGRVADGTRRIYDILERLGL